MSVLELSNKKDKNGKRNITLILHEIYPDNSIVDSTGTVFNKNGITWIKEHCEKAIESIKGMSLTAEFIDEERTEIHGHGDTGIADNLPVFENASMIGVFEKAKIKNLIIDGNEKCVMLGYASLDEMRYKNFVEKLERQYKNNETIFGSVEIIGLPKNNNQIQYLDGFKPKGRIPTEFRYSGFALLGVEPSDNTAKLIELNYKNHREESEMDELKKIISELSLKVDKGELYKKKYEENKNKILELNNSLDVINKECELSKEMIKKLNEKIENYKLEKNEANKEIEKLKTKEQIDKLDIELKQFTEEQISNFKEDIELFKKDPINSGITIENLVNKIYADIGKSTLKQVSEQNNLKHIKNSIDIFGEISELTSPLNVSIF